MKSPRTLGLPFDDWRPGQRLAIRTAQYAKTTHVVINAPTGSGKSTIAAALPMLTPERRHVTLTATKGLEDQYTRTFKDLVDLRGMANYECLAARDEFRKYFGVKRRHVGCDEGPCHDGENCSLKENGCLYYDARRLFLSSPAGLTNYSAWLSNRRFGQGLGQADVLTLDEAHALPEQLMSAYRIEIPFHLLDAQSPKTWRGWTRWAAQKLEDLGAHEGDDDQRRRRQRVEQTLKELSRIDETWAWDKDQYHHQYVFEPTIPRLLLPLLHTFDNESTIVYLSATIMPSTLDLLDVDRSDVTYLQLESTFPVSRRPVWLKPVVSGNYRSMKQRGNFGRMVDGVDNEIANREGRRGIVHSISFDRAAAIYEASANQERLLLHTRQQSGASIVEQFKNSRQCDLVLVSPSVMTGYDFPYRECEFQILPKMPFPDTRSRIAKARMDATPGYRDNLILQSLMQACGRPMRSPDDSGETIITDSDAIWWWRQHGDEAPDWFRESVRLTRRSITPLKKL